MGKLLIGWAEESLVPTKKASLDGQFFERISEEVESEIAATAMAVESNGDQMILVSVDIVLMYDSFIDLVREKFAKLVPDFDPKKLIICATHTHTSLSIATPPSNLPKVRPLFSRAAAILEEFSEGTKKYSRKVVPDDTVITPQEATEFVSDKIALAAKKAWENRGEAYYTNEFGRAAVGMCRRVSYDDGSAQMWGDTNTANFVSMEGGSDSGIELLYVFDKNKTLTGVVANIACPAQILEQRSIISADFWGSAKANMRKKLGEKVHLLTLCGAAGDQCPRDLVRWVEPETPIDDPNVNRPHVIKHKADPSMYDVSGCNKVGKRIANEIVSVYEDITELKDDALLCHEVITLDLPLRKVTMKEHDNAVREIERYVDRHKNDSFNYEDVARIHANAGVIMRYRDQQENEITPIEFHVVRFGNVAIVTNPFELFLDYGNRIKARSYAEQTFIVQLCCGARGYLPTEKAEKAGHYSAYISSGEVGHEGGDLLVRRTITEINKMFS